jgi:hypothetical protein
MTGASRPSLCGWVPEIASVGVIVIGCLVLVGWAIDDLTLASVVPGLKPMNPTTAPCLVLAGWALWLLHAEPVGRVARHLASGGALVVALVGLARIGAYLTTWDVGVDQLLFHDRLAAVPHGPNRLPPITAVNLSLVGTALLLLDVETRRGRRPAQYLDLLVAVSCLVAGTG